MKLFKRATRNPYTCDVNFYDSHSLAYVARSDGCDNIKSASRSLKWALNHKIFPALSKCLISSGTACIALICNPLRTTRTNLFLTILKSLPSHYKNEVDCLQISTLPARPVAVIGVSGKNFGISTRNSSKPRAFSFSWLMMIRTKPISRSLLEVSWYNLFLDRKSAASFVNPFQCSFLKSYSARKFSHCASLSWTSCSDNAVFCARWSVNKT